MKRSLPAAATAIASAVLILGCSSGPPPAAITPPPAASAPPAASPPASPRPAARYPSSWTLPDRKLSPGAVQPGYTIRDICPDVNKVLEAMRPSTAEKARVYRAYGIFSHPAGKYEVDHIIPIELLGEAGIDLSDPTRNLYPELNDTPDPVMLHKYGLSPAFVHNSKDILEDVLHEDVCAGTVPLATAQHAIATDWRAAYARYVGPVPHPAPAPARAAIAPPSSHRAVVTHSAVPVRTHSAVPVQAGCHPVTSGGNCYRAGEFCRSPDHGTSGITGSGERITCAENGTRWRWEPA